MLSILNEAKFSVINLEHGAAFTLSSTFLAVVLTIDLRKQETDSRAWMEGAEQIFQTFVST